MAAVSRDRVAVIVFAKPPRPGQAKTRLAAALGDDVAGALARAFVLDTWTFVQSLPWADPILATTDVADPFWRELGDLTLWPQGDGDLGDRMGRAIRRALETHDRVIVLGSDMPGLPEAALTQARDALRDADVVIGPSEDGGYYLIGFRGACPADAFAGVAWSTARTRAETNTRLLALGLVVVNVMPWFDIDEVEDLQRLHHLGDRLRPTAPETAAVIETLDLTRLPIPANERREGTA